MGLPSLLRAKRRNLLNPRNDNGIGDYTQLPQFPHNFALTLTNELSILCSLRGEFGG